MPKNELLKYSNGRPCLNGDYCLFYVLKPAPSAEAPNNMKLAVKCGVVSGCDVEAEFEPVKYIVVIVPGDSYPYLVKVAESQGEWVDKSIRNDPQWKALRVAYHAEDCLTCRDTTLPQVTFPQPQANPAQTDNKPENAAGKPNENPDSNKST